jgi:hypothetical protein
MEDPKIKLPEPIRTTKIQKKLDLFSKDSAIQNWAGYDVIDTLFYLYLFNKYKQTCLVNDTSEVFFGVKLIVKTSPLKAETDFSNKHLPIVAKQISDCIKKMQKQ